MRPDRMSNTWQPIKLGLQNEILTRSIAQEIEKMEIKTGGRKEAVNANKETRGNAKRWAGKEFDNSSTNKNCTWLFLWINLKLNLPTWFFSTGKIFPDSGIWIPLHEERKFMMWGLKGFKEQRSNSFLQPVSQFCYHDTRTQIAQIATWLSSPCNYC